MEIPDFNFYKSLLDPNLTCISLGDLQLKKKISFKVLEKVNLFLWRNEKY